MIFIVHYGETTVYSEVVMRIFALETNRQKILERFCYEGECVVCQTHYHGLSFLFAVVKEIIITTVLIGIGITAWYFELPMGWTVGILGTLWVTFAFFNMLKAYIDWYFDMIIVTSDKVILIDQTSIFHREVSPIHLDNIGSITAETQYWNLFPFGALRFHLKEGLGGDDIMKRYVPHAQEVAGHISDCMTKFQRRSRKQPATDAPAEPPLASPSIRTADPHHSQLVRR